MSALSNSSRLFIGIIIFIILVASFFAVKAIVLKEEIEPVEQQQDQIVESRGENNHAEINEPVRSNTPVPPPTIVESITPPVKIAKAILVDDIPTTAPRLILTGRITLNDGNPADGAQVLLSRIVLSNQTFNQSAEEIPLGETTALEDGTYEIVIQDFSILYLSAVRKGAARMGEFIIDAEIFSGGLAERSGTRKIVKDIVLPPAAEIKGRVVNDENLPLEGISIIASVMHQLGLDSLQYTKSITTSGPDGIFEINDMAAGSMTLIAQSNDYVEQVLDITVPKDDIVIRMGNEGASITGHVYQKETGQSVSGAIVSLRHNKQEMQLLAPKSTSTNETGLFEIDRLAAGTYILDVSYERLYLLYNREVRTSSIRLKEGESRTDIDLYLYQGHTVTGRVTLATTDEPIKGVTVGVGIGKPDISATTDADGMYKLQRVHGGVQVPISATKKGYKPITAGNQGFLMVSLDPDQLDTTFDIELDRAITVSGVVETEAGEALGDAEIAMLTQNNWFEHNKFSAVKSNGTFEIEVSPFSSFRLKAKAPDFALTITDTFEIKDKPLTDLKIIVRSGASISGVVVNHRNEPVTDAEVSVEIQTAIGNSSINEHLSTQRTDSNGKFIMSAVPVTNIILSASKQGYANSPLKKISLVNGEDTTNVKLTLQETLTVFGRVIDEEGNPIENAGVSFNMRSNDPNISKQAQTDKYGEFSVEGMIKGSFSVSVWHEEYTYLNLQNQQIGEEELEFVLKKANKATLVGKVIDAETKNPIKDFTVNAENTPVAVEKDPENPGVFRAAQLQSGNSYRFVISADGYLYQTSEYVRVPDDGDEFEQIFEMGRGGSVKGRVIDQESKTPLEDVRVVLKTRSDAWNREYQQSDNIIRTNAKGTFQVDQVPTGYSVVTVIPPEPQAYQIRYAVVESGKETDMGDIEVGEGSIIMGHITQMPGEVPLVGKRIEMSASDVQNPRITKSDENGYFEFTNVKNGQYFVKAPEYNVQQWTSVQINGTSEVNIRVGLGVLNGTILKQGKPIVAAVQLTQGVGAGKGANSDAEGHFQIKELTPGRWVVQIYDQNNYNSNFEDWVDIAVEGPTEKTFRFPSGRIFGRVIDANDEALEGAKVAIVRMEAASEEDSFSPKTWNATSNKDGFFEVLDLPGGMFSVSGSKENMGVDVVDNIDVPEGGDALEVVLRLGVAGGTLVSQATVLDDSKIYIYRAGDPLPSAWCYLTNENGARFEHGKQRDRNGVMTIENLPPGLYHMQVSSLGFSVSERTVEINVGETVTIKDELYNAGALRWSVQNLKGEAVAGADCYLEPNDPKSIEKPREGKTDQNGLWIVRGLYPGEYSITCVGPNGFRVTDNIQIAEHDLSQKRATLE